MAEPNDLPARKAMLAAVETEIANRTQAFEDSIADLRKQHETLRSDYADALRAELAKVDDAPAQRPGLGSILAAIEKTRQPITVEQLRDLADRHVSARLIRRRKTATEMTWPHDRF